MGFSEKMRESLGAEGARLELSTPAEGMVVGNEGTVQLVIVGGTRAAHVDAVIVRVIEADRHWLRQDGTQLSEEEARDLDRAGLTAGWERRTVGQERIKLDRDVEPGERVEVDLIVPIPGECKATSVACSHTLNVQADIKGQIDPTANARITVHRTPGETPSPTDPSESADSGAPVDAAGP